MAVRMTVAGAGQYILIGRDKQWVTLEQHLSVSKQIHIPATLPGRPKPLEIPVVEHSHGPVGGKMFIEIVQLRACIVGKETNLSAHAWCASWMGWWQKKIQKVGLDPTFHFRRGSAGKAKVGGPPALWRGIDLCKHPQPLLSSLAFMILLQQWCTRSRQKTDEGQLEAWRGFRKGLLDRILPEAASISLYDDIDTGFCSGGLCGKSARSASIERGRLIVREVEGSSEAFMLAFGSSEDDGRKVETLLDELGSMGVNGMWMMKQLAFHLATFLEATMQQQAKKMSSLRCRDRVLGERRRGSFSSPSGIRCLWLHEPSCLENLHRI